MAHNISKNTVHSGAEHQGYTTKGLDTSARPYQHMYGGGPDEPGSKLPFTADRQPRQLIPINNKQDDPDAKPLPKINISVENPRYVKPRNNNTLV